jgi:hypothetical protein
MILNLVPIENGQPRPAEDLTANWRPQESHVFPRRHQADCTPRVKAGSRKGQFVAAFASALLPVALAVLLSFIASFIRLSSWGYRWVC